MRVMTLTIARGVAGRPCLDIARVSVEQLEKTARECERQPNGLTGSALESQRERGLLTHAFASAPTPEALQLPTSPTVATTLSSAFVDCFVAAAGAELRRVMHGAAVDKTYLRC